MYSRRRVRVGRLPPPVLWPPKFERGSFKGGIEIGGRACVLGCVGGDTLPQRDPLPLPEPFLYHLAGGDRCEPLECGSFLTQGSVDGLREGEVKALHPTMVSHGQ